MISPLAYINPGAKIGENVTIHPFAYIDDNVVIGDNCEILPYASLMSGTRLGKGNKVFQGAVIAAVPQDFAYKGDDTVVVIGDNNVIREYVVINRATTKEGQTVIGNHNFLLEGTHLSHDTKVGDYCVFGYGCKLAGDCVIGDYVIFGGNVLMAQGCRVGTWSWVRSGCRFNRDIPPYIVAAREPVTYSGVNTKVLSKHDFPEKTINHIAHAYRLVYQSNTSLHDAVFKIRDQVPMSDEIEQIISFLSATQLGIIR